MKPFLQNGTNATEETEQEQIQPTQQTPSPHGSQTRMQNTDAESRLEQGGPQSTGTPQTFVETSSTSWPTRNLNATATANNGRHQQGLVSVSPVDATMLISMSAFGVQLNVTVAATTLPFNVEIHPNAIIIGGCLYLLAYICMCPVRLTNSSTECVPNVPDCD